MRGLDDSSWLAAAALHHAADAGHTEVVATLVIAGTSVLRVDARGYTAAHLAASRGHVDVLDKLLMAGAQFSYMLCACSCTQHHLSGGGRDYTRGLISSHWQNHQQLPGQQKVTIPRPWFKCDPARTRGRHTPMVGLCGALVQKLYEQPGFMINTVTAWFK